MMKMIMIKNQCLFFGFRPLRISESYIVSGIIRIKLCDFLTGLGALIVLEAVSYTHLDVYKRQVL